MYKIVYSTSLWISLFHLKCWKLDLINIETFRLVLELSNHQSQFVIESYFGIFLICQFCIWWTLYWWYFVMHCKENISICILFWHAISLGKNIFCLQKEMRQIIKGYWKSNSKTNTRYDLKKKPINNELTNNSTLNTKNKTTDEDSNKP